jgi:hypothetical protein
VVLVCEWLLWLWWWDVKVFTRAESLWLRASDSTARIPAAWATAHPRWLFYGPRAPFVDRLCQADIEAVVAGDECQVGSRFFLSKCV